MLRGARDRVRQIKLRPGVEVSRLISHACKRKLLVCLLGRSGFLQELLRGYNGHWRPGPWRLIKSRPGVEASLLTSHACKEELLVCPLGLSGSSNELLRGSSGLRPSSLKLTDHLLPGVEVVS